MERSQTNTMIDLKNITKEGNVIKALVIISQTHPEQFEIEVDIKEQKILRCTRNIIDSFVANAVAKLVRISEESGDSIPKESQSVWY